MNINCIWEEFSKYMSPNLASKRLPPEFIFSNSFCLDFSQSIAKNDDLEFYLNKIEKLRNSQLKELQKADFESVFYLVAQLFNAYSATQDLRFINTALKLLEKSLEIKCGRKYHNLCERLISFFIDTAEKHTYSISNRNLCLFSEREVFDPIKELDMITLHANQSDKVVVFSPNPRSNYTLALLALLERKGIVISAVVVRKLLNPKRILKEFRRDGSRLIRKVYRKLILNDRVRQNSNGRNLGDTINELGVKESSVFQWCRKRRIDAFSCDEFNDDETIQFLKRCDYSFGIFTGGGILSSAVLDTAAVGILNCHAGLLPHYRGMDVIEWPVLLDDKKNIGSTVHFMSKGIDQGDMLLTFPLPRLLDIKSARYEIESFAPYLQSLALIRFLNDKTSFRQELSQGKHFFVLHPSLYDLALKRSS